MIKKLVNSWYQKHPIRFLLWPFSLCYQFIVLIRKYAYRTSILASNRLPVPVIIVGNISVGGTGKTPFVIWLAAQLKSAGYQPGIISRGYGGKAEHYPLTVSPDTPAEQAGDEPVIIATRTGCPVVVDPNRSQAGYHLLNQFDCNVIISDDGMQHYALQRDIQIAVVDGERLFGNQLCLPAGPLREPLSSLKAVDFIVYNGKPPKSDSHSMQLQADFWVNIQNPQQRIPVNAFSNQPAHAVAGIGNPSRFFNLLRDHKIDVIEHDFNDHHAYTYNDFNFGNELPILMTEKDAVKCHQFAKSNYWYLSISALLDDALPDKLLSTLQDLADE